MAHSIYATFATERDAERATGALLDHGIAAEDVSFVISDPLLHPTVFHPTADSSRPAATAAGPLDAVPPPSAPLPGTYSAGPGGTARPAAQDSWTSPAVRPATGGTATVADTYARNAAPAVNAAVLPGDTPQEVVEHEPRPHIVDMESDRPEAADGISTTTASDAAKGAVGGAGIGVGLGILLGIAAVMVPGVGLVAGTGALVAGLAAATGAAGAVAGGVFGYLADLGLPAENARLLSDHLEAGGVVLHVEATGTLPDDEIIRILTKYGATSAQGF